MDQALFILIILLIAPLFYVLYASRKAQKNSYIENSAKLTIYGNVQFADGIDRHVVSKIELYSDKIMINKVAMIPIKRIEKVEYSKVIRKETKEDGNAVNRYFGDLKILFIDKNGQDSFIQCETPKHNQFHFMSQYEDMKKAINNLIGVGNQTTTAPLQEPYEL
ncbi:hypothetical protein ACFOU2_20130 [Bacillus songklensis]|uniref:Uncharacterized protein n=1 Tax=Bacillus songklensis TaxID=1069116 RepID=A0ABV8B6Z6_9BACI